jgi:hypothetical protein
VVLLDVLAGGRGWNSEEDEVGKEKEVQVKHWILNASTVGEITEFAKEKLKVGIPATRMLLGFPHSIFLFGSVF